MNTKPEDPAAEHDEVEDGEDEIIDERPGTSCAFLCTHRFSIYLDDGRRDQEEKEEKEAKKEETRTERPSSTSVVQVFPGRHLSRGRAAAVQRRVRKSSGEAQNSMAYHLRFLAILGG